MAYDSFLIVYPLIPARKVMVSVESWFYFFVSLGVSEPKISQVFMSPPGIIKWFHIVHISSIFISYVPTTETSLRGKKSCTLFFQWLEAIYLFVILHSFLSIHLCFGPDTALSFSSQEVKYQSYVEEWKAFEIPQVLWRYQKHNVNLKVWHDCLSSRFSTLKLCGFRKLVGFPHGMGWSLFFKKNVGHAFQQHQALGFWKTCAAKHGGKFGRQRWPWEISL